MPPIATEHESDFHRVAAAGSRSAVGRAAADHGRRRRARGVHRRYLPTNATSSRSAALDELLGCQAFLKCENLQPIGAFKVRGGLFLLSQLSPEERARGVVTASTGNHGQSIAYAAREFGIGGDHLDAGGGQPAQGRLDAPARRRRPLRRPRFR